MYDAIKALDIDPTVVTTGLCLGTPMTDHLRRIGESGDYPNGWYFGTYGYSYYMPADTPGSQESGYRQISATDARNSPLAISRSTYSQLGSVRFVTAGDGTSGVDAGRAHPRARGALRAPAPMPGPDPEMVGIGAVLAGRRGVPLAGPTEERVDRLLTAAAERYLAKRRPTDHE
jgi:hypothetical protein